MREFFRRIFSRFPERRLAFGELPQTGGEFTVHDLREFGLGPEKTDRSGERGRAMLYVDDVVPVRLVPVSLLNLVQESWKEHKEIEPVIESLWTSFWVFRECVNDGVEVPLVKKDNEVWEWPEPAGFNWGDENIKMLAMLLGAYGKQSEAEISITEGNTIHKLRLPSGTVSSKEVPDLVAHPDQHLKFKISSLGEVRMINQQAWQTHSLRTWAGVGGLGPIFGELIHQRLDRSWAESYVMSMVEALKTKSVEMPVVRYAKKGEILSSWNLWIGDFG